MDLLGIHRDRLQAEMLDQLAQGIGTGHRVVVDLGDAGFIHGGRGIEFAREDLTAQAVGCLENRDATEVAEFSFQVPGAHQPPGAAADDCKVKHVCSVVLRARWEAPELSRISRSAFPSEGKMNKAGSCIAATKENSENTGGKPA